MSVSASGSRKSGGQKQVTPQTKAEPKKVENVVKEIEDVQPEVKAVKIEEKIYYLTIFRQTPQDMWAFKGLGSELFRNKSFAEDAVPPNATESYILEIKLPV